MLILLSFSLLYQNKQILVKMSQLEHVSCHKWELYLIWRKFPWALCQSFAKLFSASYSRQTLRTIVTPLKGGVTLGQSIPASHNPATRTLPNFNNKAPFKQTWQQQQKQHFPFRDKTADVIVSVWLSVSNVEVQ